ncbi:MAG: ankyrin repeat domain-containing protein [Acidobacteria bacterium]|nr:ankyrin repeat domain-containing protein [Acidobacteriota bacterium]
MRLTLIALGLVAGLGAEVKLPPAASYRIDFDKHVKPILAERCFSCHGARQQQSGLRLDKRQNALRGGDYGPVIIAGKSAESKLIRKLVDGDGGMLMPPTGALAAEEIGILRAWIDQGGEYGDVSMEEKERPVKPVDPRVKELIRAIRGQELKVEILLQARPALVKSEDAGGSTPLHHAAGFGSRNSLKRLLDAGADVNAANRLQSTPLHWAIHDEAKVRMLIDGGANVNAKTVDGRTPLYLAATQRQGNGVLQLLLEKGADPNIPTIVGRTPLMAAAGGGNVEAMRMLLAKNANVKHVSGNGSAALMDAAVSGKEEAVRLLLANGAAVNHETKRKMTALHTAAMRGNEASVRMLLDAGAELNLQDERGYSPLMYAAYSESMPAGVVILLLAKGARRDYEGEGETAVTLAGKRGDNEVARLLGVPEAIRKSGGVAPARNGNADASRIPAAITQAAMILEKQSPNFVKRGGCNSCHNQSLPSAALSLARDRGFQVPPQLTMLPASLSERSPELAMIMGVIGVNSTVYELFGYANSHRSRDEYTEALARYLKMMQNPDGYWETTGSRPPLTSDHFQTTAMAVYALRQYAPAAENADTLDRLNRAAVWLTAARPVTTQERAFHLLGLYWACAKADVVEKAARELAKTQRSDGGWAQLPTMGTDAYATGEAVYALVTAAKWSASEPVMQKGARYLLGTQAADGSWHVKTRSLPFQPYFDAGFPYAHDQWISSAGTSWAIMALASMEAKGLARR